MCSCLIVVRDCFVRLFVCDCCVRLLCGIVVFNCARLVCAIVLCDCLCAIEARPTVYGCDDAIVCVMWIGLFNIVCVCVILSCVLE